jgi:hypothetical protein
MHQVIMMLFYIDVQDVWIKSTLITMMVMDGLV